jgi:hypothetical protein
MSGRIFFAVSRIIFASIDIELRSNKKKLKSCDQSCQQRASSTNVAYQNMFMCRMGSIAIDSQSVEHRHVQGRDEISI